MSRTRVALIAAIGAVVMLAACSSANNSTPTTTTAPPAASTTSTSAGATTSTAGPTSAPAVSTSTAPPPTAANAVRIVTFTGPASPVTCNAPTSVEVHFQTQNATSVTLRINGGAVFATYSNGTHDKLVPLTCAGSPQKYLLTAGGANGVTVSKTLTIATRMQGAS